MHDLDVNVCASRRDNVCTSRRDCMMRDLVEIQFKIFIYPLIDN
jgi:hypothetical protein